MQQPESHAFVPDSKESEIDLREIFLTLRTNLKLMVVTALIAAFAALLFCLSVTPLYTGTVNIVVDPRRLQIFGMNQNRQDNSVLSDAPIDNNTIDSFVSTLTAETVLARVVKKLDLVSDPEFNGSDKNIIQVVLEPILSLMRSGDAPTEDQKIRSVINALNKRLKVVRTGTSYNIEINVDATTPRKAATIANGVADAFIEDQLASNVGTLQRASVWLEERLKDLRDKVASADLAVLRFRQDNQVDQSTRSRELQVQLRTLDSLAQSYRSLYDTLLQRYNFAVEQQSFPSEVARVVTRAVPPNEKSFPKTFIFLAIAFIAGLGGGAFYAIVRSIFDSSIRTRADLGSVTHVECLALIPDLPRGQPTNPTGNHPLARVVASVRHSLTSLSVSLRRKLGRPNVPMKWQDFVASISDDGSRANQIPPELLQRAKLITDASDSPKTVSFLSCLPGEGKTVCNIAFARLLSRSGAKVLLIDADLKRPSATALMSGPIAARFADSMPDNEDRVQAVNVEGDQFYFLPLVKERVADQPTQTLLARDIPALLTRARDVFDYVIVDLPPIGLTSDAGLLEPGIDGFFLVVKWGSTTNETIVRSLSSSRAINRKLFGAVLNQVDITWLSRAERDPSIVMTYPYAY